MARIRAAVEQDIAAYRSEGGFAIPMSAHVITAATADSSF
jgi:hypothetical protein